MSSHPVAASPSPTAGRRHSPRHARLQRKYGADARVQITIRQIGGPLSGARVRYNTAVATAPVNAQAMTLEDIALYEPKTRDPLCAPYRDYTVCGMGPPTSGGVAVLQVHVAHRQRDDGRFGYLS